MTELLKAFLSEHEIIIVNEIIDKRNGSSTVGYHLRSPSIDTHDITFQNLSFFIKNFNQPYYVTDGYDFLKRKNDIYLHNLS